jgi:hypothetical protein
MSNLPAVLYLFICHATLCHDKILIDLQSSIYWCAMDAIPPVVSLGLKSIASFVQSV